MAVKKEKPEKKPKQKRVNDIVLGPLERPALKWLAAHMPVCVTPDILTGIGLFASILIAVSYGLTRINTNFLWLASFGFILNWFGDSLDGTLARHRKIERPKFGYFIDHVVDTVGIVLVCIGLGISPYVNIIVGLMGAIIYLQASILVYLLNNVNQVFELSFAKIGPTEVRLIAIIANIVLYFTGIREFTTLLGGLTLFDFAIIVLCIFIILMMFIRTAKEVKRLAKEEAPILPPIHRHKSTKKTTSEPVGSIQVHNEVKH